MYKENIIKINNKNVSYWKVNHDVNGNPRYVIHFLDIADNYDEALKIARGIGGKIYRAKWFGGGFIFQSYNLESDLKLIIK